VKEFEAGSNSPLVPFGVPFIFTENGWEPLDWDETEDEDRDPEWEDGTSGLDGEG
jgi:hypothetical protein